MVVVVDGDVVFDLAVFVPLFDFKTIPMTVEVQYEMVIEEFKDCKY